MGPLTNFYSGYVNPFIDINAFFILRKYERDFLRLITIFYYKCVFFVQDMKMYFLYRQVSLAQAEKVLLKDNFEQVRAGKV